MRRIFSIVSGFALLLQLAISTVPAAAAASVHYTRTICPADGNGRAHCHAYVESDAFGRPLANISYTKGLKPADLHDAYNLPAIPSGVFAWNGQTIAIVDAYDNPNAVSDLAKYRAQFGLPLCSDGTAGCILSKINGNGTAALPAPNVAWGQEINLDVDMAAAACPQCKILLVETNSASMANLAAAEDTAAARGVTAISNSYGGSEFPTEVNQEVHYNHPGIAITVSAGDSGYGAEYPAASQYVTAVGGTTLARSSNARGWTEAAWSGTGSGCSRYISAPAWQTPVGTCKKRTVADVAAVADPTTGVAVYDSYGSSRGANWFVFGGTSAAAPLIAGVYAQAKAAGVAGFTYGERPYAHTANLFDITAGKNGACSTNYKALCTAGLGYDGPTGLGSPNGLNAF